MSTKILALPISLALFLIIASDYKFKEPLLKKPIATIDPLSFVVQKEFPVQASEIFDDLDYDEITQEEPFSIEETKETAQIEAQVSQKTAPKQKNP